MRYNFNLYRIIHTKPPIGGQRLTVKRFASSDAMYRFMQKENNGHAERDWRECHASKFDNLKPGVYAYAGQQWHNVKKLDATALAHI